MKCLVAVKRVIDFNVKVRIKVDGSNVETERVKMSMNPFDEIALEAAVRLKEAGIVNEIIAIAIGPIAAQEILRVALARDADRGILVETSEMFEPLNIAKILHFFVKQENPDLVFLGKQAIDDDCNQTGQMLAALLSWPQGTNVSRLMFHSENKQVDVTREIDGGLQTLTLKLPAVITTDLRLNKPRYISLSNVMKAKSKKLELINVEDLKLNLKQRVQQLRVEPPLMHRQGSIVNNVEELLDKLRNEVKVI